MSDDKDWSVPMDIKPERALDVVHASEAALGIFRDSMSEITEQWTSPSVIYRPRLSLDGNKWCVLYGENLHDGVAGFGDTPELACRAFDKAWVSERPPEIKEG